MNTLDSTTNLDSDNLDSGSLLDAPNSTKTDWKPVYKGLRLGNAAELPHSTRTSTVRNLLRMVTHKFNYRDYDAHPKERLKIADVIISQGIGPWGIGMYTFAIVKIPAEMKMAKGRFVEGPVIGVNVRHEVVFKNKQQILRDRGKHSGYEKKDTEPAVPEDWDTLDRQGSAFDFSREVASMLVLALQRNREGKGTREVVHEKESRNLVVDSSRALGGWANKMGTTRM